MNFEVCHVRRPKFSFELPRPFHSMKDPQTMLRDDIVKTILPLNTPFSYFMNDNMLRRNEKADSWWFIIRSWRTDVFKRSSLFSWASPCSASFYRSYLPRTRRGRWRMTNLLERAGPESRSEDDTHPRRHFRWLESTFWCLSVGSLDESSIFLHSQWSSKFDVPFCQTYPLSVVDGIYDGL